MDGANQQFVKCQGTKLLSSLPASVRQTIHHYEVAGVLRPFSPRAPLPPGPGIPSKCFLYVVVTDWSILFMHVSSKQHASLALELPLLMIHDLHVAAIDVQDVANVAGQSAAPSAIITLYPEQDTKRSQQLHEQSLLKEQPLPQHIPHQPTPHMLFQWQQQQQQPLAAAETQRKQQPQQPAVQVQEQSRHRRRRSSSSSSNPMQWLALLVPCLNKPHKCAGQVPCQHHHQHHHQQQPVVAHQMHMSFPQLHRLQQQQQEKHERGVTAPQATPVAESAEMSAGVSSINPSLGACQSLTAPCSTDDSTGGSAASNTPTRAANTTITSTASCSRSTLTTFDRWKARMATAGSLASATEPSVEHVSTQLASHVGAATPGTVVIKQKQLLQQSQSLQQPQVRAHSAHHFNVNQQQNGDNHNHSQQQQQHDARLDSSYYLELITVERNSCLLYHLHKAWVGARVRAALAASAAPGLPGWLRPPDTSFPLLTSQKKQSWLPLRQQQQLEQQQQVMTAPDSTRQHQMLSSSIKEPWTRRTSENSSSTCPHAFRPSTPSAAQPPSAAAAVSSQRPPGSGNCFHIAAAAALAYNTPQLQDIHPHAAGLLLADCCHHAAPEMLLQQPQIDCPDQYQEGELISRSFAGNVASGNGSLSGSSELGGLISSFRSSQLRTSAAEVPQRYLLRSRVQGSAAMYAQPTACAMREQYWDLAGRLLQPCSLFDGWDVALMKQLMKEVMHCRRSQVPTLHQAFFSSSPVMVFLLARLTSWGVVMNLFPPGLPPIKNPTQPGQLEAWSGQPVVWASSMLYPGRPRKLFKRLSLCASRRVDFRPALECAMCIARHHSKAASRAAKAQQDGSNGIHGNLEAWQGTLPAAYYSDPLFLSPVARLPYPFVSDARRMACDYSSSSSSQAGDMQQQLGHTTAVAAGWSSDDEDGTTRNSHDLSSSGTFAEATNILRWERLVGRLAASEASQKADLLLNWLQMQLAFTEGCGARRNWFSSKTLDFGAYPTGGPVGASWTFQAATQQLLAAMMTLHLQHSDLSCAFQSPGRNSHNFQAVPAAGPQSVDHLLWWAQHGSSSWRLDHVVGVMYELMGMGELEQRLGTPSAGQLVVQVVRQVPNSHLLPLVRRMFLRDICLLSGTASNKDFAVLPPSVAAVLAYKYGSVLVEILGSVLGCADALYEHYAVELQHLMTVPQVQAQIAAAGAASGAAASMLSLHSQDLLEQVLSIVGKAVSWQRADRQLPVAALGNLASVMKVQN